MGKLVVAVKCTVCVLWSCQAWDETHAQNLLINLSFSATPSAHSAARPCPTKNFK